jgi:hypothetical protein
MTTVYSEKSISFQFAYLAYTFMYESPESKRQPSTPYPSSISSSTSIPCRPDVESKPFGDVWELRLGVPGGHFDAVDLEEEMRR